MTPWADAEGHFRPDVFARAVGNGLSVDERQKFDAHLQVCPRCRGLMAVQQRSTRGPNAVTLDGVPTVRPGHTTLGNGNTTLPVGEPAGPTLPPVLGEGGIDPTHISHQAIDPVDPRQNALTHKDLPNPLESGVDPIIGRKLGDYVVLELIAKGGMAAVYRGVQPVIGKQVAIKVLLPVTNEHDFAQRMVQEAQTVNAIAHPNIIDIFGAGALPDGRPWLVMELLAGKSVAEWVRTSSGALPTYAVMHVLEQICSALEAAHTAGVVHRDIKPANIMLTNLDEPIPRVKVVDFGLAKSGDMSLRTAPDVVLGTPGFVSPEQIQGHRATPLSDLYSVGLVGWFMLARKDPFPRDEHVLATMKRQLSEEPASLVGQPSIPSELAGLITEMCRIDPSRRPKSAAAVRNRVSTLIASTPVPTDNTVPELARVPSKPVKNPRRKSLDAVPAAPDITPKEALGQPLVRDVTPREALERPLVPDVTPKEALVQPLTRSADELTPLAFPLLKEPQPVKVGAEGTVVFGDAAPPPSSSTVPAWLWVVFGLIVVAAAAAAVAVVL